MRDIMTTDVVVVRETDTLQDISKLFFEKSISGAPVLDENEMLVGMISESDIIGVVRPLEQKLKMVYPSLSMMSVTFEKDLQEKDLSAVLREVQQKKAGEVMTREVVSLEPEDTVKKAVTLMNERNVNRLPIVSAGRVVGILTRADILRCLSMMNLSDLDGMEPPVEGPDVA